MPEGQAQDKVAFSLWHMYSFYGVNEINKLKSVIGVIFPYIMVMGHS